MITVLAGGVWPPPCPTSPNQQTYKPANLQTGVGSLVCWFPGLLAQVAALAAGAMMMGEVVPDAPLAGP